MDTRTDPVAERAAAATAADPVTTHSTSYGRATLQLPQHGPVYVVGTCHLSSNSARAAQRAVLSPERPPWAVLLELCADRVEILGYTSRPDPLPPLNLTTVKENWRMLVDPLFWFKLPFAGAEALIGSQEGYEFTAAANAAKVVGAQVVLIDRPVGATVTRLLVGLTDLTLADARKCLSVGLSSDGALAELREVTQLLNPWWGPGAANLDAAQLQRCRVIARRLVDNIDPNKDIVDLPEAVKRPLLDERDVIMSHALFHAACRTPPDRSAVAVVGAAHVPGIVRHFNMQAEATIARQPDSCSTSKCGRQDEIFHLSQRADVLPILRTATASLLGMSAVSLSGRLLFMRWLRHTNDGQLSHWCRRINIATAVAGASSVTLTTTGMATAYNTVRTLQLRCTVGDDDIVL